MYYTLNTTTQRSKQISQLLHSPTSFVSVTIVFWIQLWWPIFPTWFYFSLQIIIRCFFYWIYFNNRQRFLYQLIQQQYAEIFAQLTQHVDKKKISYNGINQVQTSAAIRSFHRSLYAPIAYFQLIPCHNSSNNLKSYKGSTQQLRNASEVQALGY